MFVSHFGRVAMASIHPSHSYQPTPTEHAPPGCTFTSFLMNKIEAAIRKNAGDRINKQTDKEEKRSMEGDVPSANIWREIGIPRDR